MRTSLQAVLPRRESDLRAAYWDQVRTFPDGDRVRNCIQCGSCTGSCPVSYAMDISPRQIVALFRAGFLEEILRSRSIWICASCYACTVRCPAGIRVTDNIYALKRVATSMHIFPAHFPAHAMAEAFAGEHQAVRAELGAVARHQVPADGEAGRSLLPAPATIRPRDADAAEARDTPARGSRGFARSGRSSGEPRSWEASDGLRLLSRLQPRIHRPPVRRVAATRLRASRRRPARARGLELLRGDVVHHHQQADGLLDLGAQPRLCREDGPRRLRPVQLLLHDPLQGQPAHAVGRGAHEAHQRRAGRGGAFLLGEGGCAPSSRHPGQQVGIEKIAAKAVRRLDGIRIAPYYGCQIVRPRRAVRRPRGADSPRPACSQPSAGPSSRSAASCAAAAGC